jgi:phosphatidylglycerol:prolipoprotein diacylglycerol transferase
MVALGFFVGALVMQWDYGRRGLPRQLAWSIIGYGIFGGVLGGRLFFLVEEWPTIEHDPYTVLSYLSHGGFSWYGGLAGTILFGSLPAWLYGVPWGTAADGVGLVTPLGYGLGRLGCHLAGDGCWGVPTRLPWGVAYTHGIVPWPHRPGVLVHPTSLYELGASLLVFAVLLRLRGRLRPDGALFAAWLVLAGAERFLVDFVRDSPPVLLGLTEAQCFSLLTAGAGALWLALRGSVARVPAPA